MTQVTADIIHYVQSFCVVPDEVQAPGVESAEYSEELKCKADAMSRLQYEVYWFVTKTNLSEAAVDELLGMLSNVCTFVDLRWLSMCNCKSLCYVLLRIITYYNLLLHTKFCLTPMQVGFSPEDIHKPLNLASLWTKLQDWPWYLTMKCTV